MPNIMHYSELTQLTQTTSDSELNSTFSGGIRIGPDLTIPVGWERPAAGILRVKLTSRITLSLLDRLADLLSVAELVPAELGAAQNIAIEALAFELDLGQRALRAVGIELSYTCSWDIGQAAFGRAGLLLVRSVRSSIEIKDPRTPARAVAVGLGADVQLGSGILELSVKLPELNLQLGLKKDTRLVASEVATLFDLPLPDTIGEVTVNDLRLSVQPRARSAKVALTLGLPWRVRLGNADFGVRELSVSMTRDPSSLTGSIGGKLILAGVPIALEASGQSGAGWTFSGQLDSVSGAPVQLSKLVSDLLPGTSLPPEVPDVALSQLSVSFSPSSGAIDISAVAASTFRLGETALEVSRLAFQFQRVAGSSAITCALDLTGSGQISAELGFPAFALKLSYDSAARSFQLGGSVSATLFGQSLALSAGLTIEGTQRSLTLGSTLAPPVRIGYDGGGNPGAAVWLALSEASLKVNSAQRGAAWALSAKGSLSAAEVLTVQSGQVTLLCETGKSGLLFTADRAEVEIPFGDRSGPRMFLGLTRLDILRIDQRWSLSASASCGLRGLPLSLDRVLGNPVQASLRIDGQGATVSLINPFPPLSFVIPPIGERPLGRVWFKVGSLSATLGAKPELNLELCVALPQQLNNLFGMSQSNPSQPAVDFFTTVADSGEQAPSDQQPWVRAKLGLNTSGITGRLLSSPIKALKLVDGTCTIDMGEYGALDLAVPTLSCQLSSASFSASGGMRIVRPLRLPTSQLKQLLEHAGLGALANGLPSSIPLDELNLLDEQELLNTQAIADLLRRLVNPLPQSVVSALELLRQISTRLPTRLLSFLRFSLPRELSYSISVDPTGTVKLDVRTSQDRPLRLLVPTLGPAGIPMLMGLELRGLSFGPVLGGTLLLLQADLTLDMFDVVTLALAASGVTQGVQGLPPTQTLCRQLVARNLFMLIFTAFPVPLPLFYDELSFTYRGIEGAEIATSWRCPMPSADLGEAMSLIRALSDFFTKSDYYLDPDKAPQNLNLTFASGPHYFALPSYLGGGVLGSKDTVLKLNAYRSLAKLLNGIKRPSASELIEILPYELRLGAVDLQLGPLGFQVDWAVASVRETAQEARDPRLQSAWNTGQALVPGWGPAAIPSLLQSDGVLLSLRGQCRVAYLGGLSGEFALCSYRSPNNTSQLHTKFRVAGDLLAGTVSASLSGELHVQPTEDSLPIAAPFRGPGWAIHFPGTSDPSAGPVVEASLSAAPVGGICVSLWLRAGSDTSQDRGLFIFFGADDPRISDSSNRALAYFPQGGHTLVFCFGRGQVSYDLKRYVGQWVHITCNVKSNSFMQMFVNGEQVVNATPATGEPTSLSVFRLGATATAVFVGQVAGLRIAHATQDYSIPRLPYSILPSDPHIASWSLGPEAPRWTTNDNAPPEAGNAFFQMRPSKRKELPKVVRLMAPPLPALSPIEQQQAQGASVLRVAPGAYVEVPGFLWPAGAPITIEFWTYVRRDQLCMGSAFSIGNQSGASRVQAHVPFANGTLYWDCGDGGQPGGRVTTDFQPYLDKWTHVALVSAGAGGGLLAIYLNGERVASLPQSQGPAQALRGLTIGRESAIPGWTYEQQALYADFRIFSYTRSEAEIRRDRYIRLRGDEPGLIAYFPLGELEGSIATDLTPLANHGTLKGADFVSPLDAGATAMPGLLRATRQDGVVDEIRPDRSVLKLDGNGYVDVPDFTWEPGAAITVEFWIYVRPDQLDVGSIFSIGNQASPNRVQAHCPWADGTLHFDYGDISTAGGRLSLDFRPYLNQWVHVALVSGGSQAATLRIYLLGKLKAEVAASGGARTALRGLTIGREQSPHGTWSQRCLVSEFKIWSLIRSEQELYDGIFKEAAGDEPGLVGYWKLCEGQGQQAYDYGVRGYHGRLVNATWADAAEPGADRALALKRTSVPRRSVLRMPAYGGYLNVPDFIWPASSAITIEFWTLVRADQLLPGAVLSVGNNQTPIRMQVHCPYQDGNLYWDYGDIRTAGGHLAANFAPFLGKWTHVALVSSGPNSASPYAAIYLNGKVAASVSAASAPPTERLGLTLGKGHDAAQEMYQQGLITDVRIWSKVRTPTEIVEQYKNPLLGSEPGLFAYWPLSESGGELAPDRTRRTAPGRLIGTSWVPSHESISYSLPRHPVSPLPAALDTTPAPLAVLSLNGTDAYVDFPDFLWPAFLPITIEFWVYTEGGPGGGLLLSIGNQAAPNTVNLSCPWADNRLYFDYGDPSQENGRVSLDFTPYLNKWTHVALVASFTSSRGMFVLLDGQGRASMPDSFGPRELLRGFTLGRLTTQGGTYYRKALVTELRVFHTARSEAEIRETLRTRLTGDEPGLSAYYPLLQSGGGKVLDRGPRGLHGTLKGKARWTSASELKSIGLPELGALPPVAPANKQRTTAFLLKGAANLRVLGQDLFNGRLQITDRSFEIEIAMNLSLLGFVSLSGSLSGSIDEQGFDFQGSGAIQVFGATLAGGSFHISPSIVEVTGTLLGIQCHVVLYRGQVSTPRSFAEEPTGLPEVRLITENELRAEVSLELPRRTAQPRAFAELPGSEEESVSALLAVPSLAEIDFSTDGARWSARGSLLAEVPLTAQVHAISLRSRRLMYIAGELDVSTGYLLAAQTALLAALGGAAPEQTRAALGRGVVTAQRLQAEATAWAEAVAAESAQLEERVAQARSQVAQVAQQLRLSTQPAPLASEASEPEQQAAQGLITGLERQIASDESIRTHAAEQGTLAAQVAAEGRDLVSTLQQLGATTPTASSAAPRILGAAFRSDVATLDSGLAVLTVKLQTSRVERNVRVPADLRDAESLGACLAALLA